MRMLVFALLVLFCSCEKTEHSPGQQPLLDVVNAQYFIKWHYPYATGENLQANARFVYHLNNPVKRSGAYLPVWGGVDPNAYTDQIYDTVIKLNSQKILVQAVNKLPSGSANLPKWEIETNDGKPVKRISYLYYAGHYIPVDTVIYYYDANKRVQKIESHSTVNGASYILTKTFFFDGENLEKVEGVYIKKPSTLQYSTTETFSLYDTKPNPLKALWFWDDLYYRTLSVNNFSKYTYNKLDAAQNLVAAFEKTWNLSYDVKGNVTFE
jgi:hypothetical protein